MMMVDLKVGQTVFAVYPNRYGDDRIYDVEVTKIGRKWAYFIIHSREQGFDKETGFMDGKGFSSPGRVWLNLADKEATETADKAYRELVRRVAHNRQSWLNLDTILAVATLLQIDHASIIPTQENER